MLERVCLSPSSALEDVFDLRIPMLVIAFLVKRGDRYREVAIAYHDGLRYPVLERVGSGSSNLDALLAPLR